jgi:transcriptional regulator with XRE-family HTH domain
MIIGYIKFHYKLCSMIILDNIRQVRESKKLSQTEVAEKIGIAYQNYWKIENEKTELTINRLYQIAEVLGVSVSELLGSDIPTKSISTEDANDNLKKRVTELEERIKELKSVIDSKDTIVHTLNVATNDLLSNLFLYLDKLLISKALELKMIDYDSTKKNIQYYYDENGNVDYWHFKSSKTEPHLNALDLLSVENLTELFVFQDVGKYCTEIVLILSEWAESPFVELDIFLTWNDLFQKLPLNERYEFILGWESQREFVKKGLVSKRK